MNRLADPILVELVDAVAAAVDVDRFDEVHRVRAALAAFGGGVLFDAELRLTGQPSTEHFCCLGECIADAAHPSVNHKEHMPCI